MEVDPRWLDDAKTLKIVRGQRGYVHDVTIVAKIVALFERIAALEAERDNAMSEALNSAALMLKEARREAAGEARREGARDALEWFVRQPRGDDSVGWVLTKSYDQMIDAALGEVDGGK